MKKIMILLIIILVFNGAFAQKITEVRKEDLPKTILKYISNNYKGATVFKAVKLDDKGSLIYNVAIDIHGRKQILVFDKDGRFLKKGDDFPKSNKKAGEIQVTQPANAPQQSSQPKAPNYGNQNDPKK
jgi:hypothetical protein